MTDVLWIYGPHNRLYYNQITLPTILAECSRANRFAHLLIIDDNSTDGTSEWIQSIDLDSIPNLKGKVTYQRQKVGNSYDQWNIGRAFANQLGGINYMMNLCNDLLIPDSILDVSAAALDSYGNAFALGYKHDGKLMEAKDVHTKWPVITLPHRIRPVKHIGAGMIRLKDMELEGDIKGSIVPGEERYFGFTQYQNLLREYHQKKMLTADSIQVLPLDKTIEYSRNEHYIAKGYSRKVVSGAAEYSVQHFK